MKGDVDATLDLQTALSSVYDGLRYDLELDYRRSPDIPFTRAQASRAAICRRRARK